MRISFIWRPRSSNVPAGERLVRFRKILASALQVGRYRATLTGAGITTAKTLSQVTDIHATLRRLPELGLEEFLDSPTGFTNPLAPTGTADRFVSPFPQTSRTAVLANSFAESDTVRNFSAAASTDLRQFQPELIAAPVSSLLTLARQVDEGTVSIHFPKHGVIALSGIVEGTLDECDRDMLWRIFRVPVYEQYLGWDGKVIARECEAHAGLHVVAENAVVEKIETGLLITSLTDLRCPTLRLRVDLEGSIHTGLCACGRSGPRLMDLHENKPAVDKKPGRTNAAVA
jgi:hypothetical protein